MTGAKELLSPMQSSRPLSSQSASHNNVGGGQFPESRFERSVPPSKKTSPAPEMDVEPPTKYESPDLLHAVSLWLYPESRFHLTEPSAQPQQLFERSGSKGPLAQKRPNHASCLRYHADPTQISR